MYTFEYNFSFCSVQQMNFDMLTDAKEEESLFLDGIFMIGISATMPMIKVASWL